MKKRVIALLGACAIILSAAPAFAHHGGGHHGGGHGCEHYCRSQCKLDSQGRCVNGVHENCIFSCR